ncbi:nuclease-related domain-containing protein [Arthrospira platensis BEA 1257B]
MKVLKQSPSLKAKFKQNINRKVSSQREEASQVWGGGFLGMIGAGVFEFKQIRNQVKGSLGENLIALLLMTFPDNWVLFKNALIPATAGSLTEIDLLLIGNRGIFLIEVKTWKGSLAGNQDNWKRREGSQWVPVSNSPTSQSLYHQQMFQRWIFSEIPGLPTDCITAPVVFPIAKWVGAKNCSVPVLTSMTDLISMIWKSPEYLTDEQVLRISKHIQEYELSPVSKPQPQPQPETKPKPKPKKPKPRLKKDM